MQRVKVDGQRVSNSEEELALARSLFQCPAVCCKVLHVASEIGVRDMGPSAVAYRILHGDWSVGQVSVLQRFVGRWDGWK